MGLLNVGELPKTTRVQGRKPGKWRGHEDMAEELRTLAKREKNADKRWGQIAEREKPAKAQAIVSAVKKGEAVGFGPPGTFDAKSRKSANQHRAPVDRRTGQPIVLYDVWARHIPSG